VTNAAGLSRFMPASRCHALVTVVMGMLLLAAGVKFAEERR
jgi:threonine/homoserine/homoserine lactone efflux protein